MRMAKKRAIQKKTWQAGIEFIRKGVSQMEESTRIIIAYAVVIIGVPLFFARICWFIPGVILAKVLSFVATGLDQILNRAVEG